ncbi:hypothetical protein SCUCBS95973_009258 [Sporothrix curviconia]|uniref:NB-ARC domain-containing protein n=1 Tax=Sporothrix curviconia TaxID=1260050 RepID=A0ABP0CTF8_9PEZI
MQSSVNRPVKAPASPAPVPPAPLTPPASPLASPPAPPPAPPAPAPVSDDAAQKAWELAVQRARTKLGAKRFARVSATANFAACLAQLQLQQSPGKKHGGFAAHWPRLGAGVRRCLDLLNTFDQAISTCCQSYADVACLIWGSVQVVLTVASKYRDTARRVVDMLETLTMSMPRFEEYLRLFPTHGRLQMRLASIFETFVLFCADACAFLQSPFSLALGRVVWFNQDRRFAAAVDRIREIGTELDREAKAADIAVGFVRETVAEQRHKDVMTVLVQAHPVMPAPPVAPLAALPVMVPYPRNMTFVGRSAEMRRLHDFFSEAAVLDSPCIVSILGQGGVGKSQLALEYLYQNPLDYHARFCIRAEGKEIIQQEFAQIGRLLNRDSQDPIQSLDKAVQSASDWLSATDKKWLLIFDNVDAVVDIHEYLPRVGHGSIIVTTRDRDIADNLGQWSKIIELEGLSKPDAGALLRQFVADEDLNPETSDELGGLPLAISLAGSYMRQTHISQSQYCSLLRGGQSVDLYNDAASVAPLPYASTLAHCCDMSIDLLSPAERHLMGVLSLFHVDQIPEELVTAVCEHVARLRYLASPVAWNDAIRTLDKYSLAKISGDASGAGACRSLRIHRVNQRRIWHGLDAQPARRAEAFADASALLCDVFPRRRPDGGTMSREWAVCEKWLMHVLSLRNAFQPSDGLGAPIPRAYAELLCNCAWYMWERGVKQAYEFVTHALHVCQQVQQGDDDTLLADMYVVVGALNVITLHAQGQALADFQKSLAIRERYTANKERRQETVSLDDRRQLANSYNNAGVAYMTMNRHAEALATLERALELKYQLGDETTIPYDIAVGLYNKARILMEIAAEHECQGKEADLSSSLELCEKALRLAVLCNGNDFRTYQFRFTYADLVLASGDLDRGLRLHEELLVERQSVMGDENNDTAVSHYGLACAYQKTGALDKALTSIESAIKIFELVPEADNRLARSHFRLHLIYKDAANVQCRLGNASDKLETLAQDALDKAHEYRRKFKGNSIDSGGDTIKDYDLLVSYYNR